MSIAGSQFLEVIMRKWLRRFARAVKRFADGWAFREACRSLGFSAIPANAPALGNSICCARSVGVCSCVMSLALGLASVLVLGSVVHAVLA